MNRDRSDVLKVIENTLAYYEKDMGHNDIQFLLRIYEEGLQKYIDRLSAIGFSSYGCVLDAGCGFGQWSLALSALNGHVYSCDASMQRIQVLSKITDSLGIKNLSPQQCHIECLSYKENTFDAVFCYSVIFITDYKKSLSEFKRVLKPGGKIYLTSNGLGWFLYLFDKRPNSAKDYDPRKTAVEVLSNTVNIGHGIPAFEDVSQIIPSSAMSTYIKKLGLKIIHIGPEGSYKKLDNNDPKDAFSIGEYLGQEAVYEIICQLD